ncbi:uncharacterized protein (DUF305 family) [Kribbella voronezhensis]|uniref:Uncharacterized protein (DUF305 family) n=1 Tax=Kribbella voronezhensis TaxID=2512212 RepID=A0A4R7T748_9ACTN|nr:DUF305 domain-containing protein [Kribbella voronezhensis]TDU87429.1 uncharacterized protein (DUF305 family) [Kribbella voronezhensis]
MKALAVMAVLLGLLGVTSGCGDSSAASPPPATTVVETDPAFNPTDLAWIELMIPMDQQLLRVLAMAKQQSANLAVRAFAASMAAGHQTELTQLIALRTRAKAPTANQHEGHDMPGMMTEPEVVALSNTTGPAFDTLFEKNLKEHLEQSIIVARSIRTAGQEHAVKTLAASIEHTRATQLKHLATL